MNTNEITFEFPEIPQFDFFVDLQGASLYQKWLELGNEGTHLDFLNWLKIKGDIGDTGASCEFQVSATHIQWRVVGDADWIDLIALSAFKGDKGDAFTYEDFTPEQISELQRPVTDVIEAANIATGNANEAAEAANIATGNANEAAGVALAAAAQLEVDLSGKVDKQEGYSLMLDTEIERLASVYNVDITGKVDKVTGYSLVADTDIAKIHARNTDSTLLSENGEHSIYIDNAGVFHVKSISQSGASYETHAEQVFTTKNEIILRDGAIAGLAVGEYVGLRAKLYDGVNDGNLVFDKDGWARVGDVGALQKLATIEETPTDGGFAYYYGAGYQLKTRALLATDIPTLAQSQINNLTSDLGLLAPKANPVFTGTLTLSKIKPPADSTTALQITKANGTTSVLNVDTINLRLGVNAVAPIAAIHIEKGTDSVGLNNGNARVLLNVDANNNPSLEFHRGKNGFLQGGLAGFIDFCYTSDADFDFRIGMYSATQLILQAATANFSIFDKFKFINSNAALLINTTADNGTDKLQVNGSILGTTLKTSAGTLTYGANDSAGAGYRYVRVPNA